MRHEMKHLVESFRHHARLQFATVLVLVASFTVIAGVLTINSNMQKILTLWGESLQMSIYLSDNVSTEQVSSVQKYLTENTNVDKLKFVSKEDALVNFREQMASYAPDILKDNDLLKFLPSSFQFSLSSVVSSTDQLQVMKDLAVALKVQPGVDEVSYGQDWIKSYASLTTGLNWVGLFFVLFVFISTGFVMSNSIQSSIEQRRSEIEVMELVGATSRYVRRPFLIEGAVMGGVSCALALTLAFGIFQSVSHELKTYVSFMQLSQHLSFLGFGHVAFLFVFSVLMGAGSSWLCVKRINTGWAASQKANG